MPLTTPYILSVLSVICLFFGVGRLTTHGAGDRYARTWLLLGTLTAGVAMWLIWHTPPDPPSEL